MLDSRPLKFRNEPFTDFSSAQNERMMRDALRLVRSQLGRTYPAVVGKNFKVTKTFKSINPSRFTEVVGVCEDASPSLADRAMETATRTFPEWSRRPVKERAQLLRRMAALLRKRKFEFCAWLIYEVGKNRAEADADVAETIDFLEYYAELAVQSPAPLVAVQGEQNTTLYRAIGPVVVISPWNFPLAILVGMVSAALVTGNTVVAKPSNQSPIIAAKFIELTREAGLPEGVLSFLSSQSTRVGEYLVKDSRTRMVAFTGSRAVGLRINEIAAKTPKGQRWIKRVIAEMGGKDAIIVDESADLDSAAAAVFASAFGYQGQKCSACSRLYVHRRIYAEFMSRLADRMRNMRVGPADQADNFMGPVISKAALQKIERYVALGKKQGRLLTPLAAVSQEGFFASPAVFEGLPRSSRLWTEEIFGPVVAVDAFATFEEALERANGSEYGLTGAVFSQEEGHQQLARDRFHCGNLYFNRKCTGALVGVHPFGGFDMSGTDSKAGGPDYLTLFTQAQTISEKTCS